MKDEKKCPKCGERLRGGGCVSPDCPFDREAHALVGELSDITKAEQSSTPPATPEPLQVEFTPEMNRLLTNLAQPSPAGAAREDAYEFYRNAWLPEHLKQNEHPCLGDQSMEFAIAYAEHIVAPIRAERDEWRDAMQCRRTRAERALEASREEMKGLREQLGEHSEG